MFNQVPQNIVQINRLPILIGIIVLFLVAGILMYRSQSHQKTETVHDKPPQSLDISPRGAEAGWFNDQKFRNIKLNNASAQRTFQEIEKSTIKSQEIDLRKKEIEDEYSTRLEIKKMQDKNKIEEIKLEWEAMKSPLSIGIPLLPGSPVMPSKKETGKEDLTEELNGLINMVKSVTAAKFPGLVSRDSDINNQDDKHIFLRKIDVDNDYLENSKNNPRSRYEVKAGSYIPAALITGIDSDLPGSVNAQVTDNVFDTVTGNYLLIPQGSKLIGEYNSSLSFGQKRVQVVWNKIIFPDGKSMDLERMQGADIAGYTGFQGKVDNHYLRIYGNAILLSLMGAGYDILNKKAVQNTDPREMVAANVGQKLADVSEQSLQKNIDVQPTIIIDPGYRFKIIVMKDMVLEDIDDAPGALAYTK